MPCTWLAHAGPLPSLGPGGNQHTIVLADNQVRAAPAHTQPQQAAELAPADCATCQPAGQPAGLPLPPACLRHASWGRPTILDTCAACRSPARCPLPGAAS
jgi:hypothetical protein